MPELCRFHGATIKIYHDDHAPPHVHVRHGGRWAKVGIAPAQMMSGALPPNIERLVLEWARVREREITEAWGRVQNGEQPGKIAPLD